MYEVATFGEKRSDIRHAISTVNLIASQMKEPMTDDQFREIVNAMASYMPGESDDDDDDLFDTEALALLRGE